MGSGADRRLRIGLIEGGVGRRPGEGDVHLALEPAQHLVEVEAVVGIGIEVRVTLRLRHHALGTEGVDRALAFRDRGDGCDLGPGRVEGDVVGIESLDFVETVVVFGTDLVGIARVFSLGDGLGHGGPGFLVRALDQGLTGGTLLGSSRGHDGSGGRLRR